MKKIFLNNRIIAIAFMTVFSTALATTSNATGTNPVKPIEVTYIGQIQNNPVFQLSVNGNNGEDDYTIKIRDEFGNSLHFENIKAESFTKKFMLDMDNIGDFSIEFLITSKKTKNTTSYVVNSNSKNITEITVNQQ